MIRILWEAALLAAAALGSWFLFLRAPEPATSGAVPLPSREQAPVIEVLPLASYLAPSEPAESALAAPPPPPERGAPEGEPDGERLAGGEAEERADPESAAAEPAAAVEPRPGSAGDVVRILSDLGLVERAEDELGGTVRKGFETVLLAAPEDQIDIARFFREQLVLVPRAALDPANEAPRYYMLDTGTLGVLQIDGRPPLTQHRQYRDLFDYEYRRLPEPLRALRRAHLNRSDVYLFGALLSAREWALAIHRREAALAAMPGPEKAVRRFELRYRRLPGGAFDLAVERILFADGTSYRPDSGRQNP